MSNEYWLKGGDFQNRYVIEGTLTTKTPLHIGSGSPLTALERMGKEADQKAKEKKGPNEVSGVVCGLNQKPYLPGSAIRGNLRSWLLQLFGSLPGSLAANGNSLAFDNKPEELMATNDDYQKQNKQIDFMKNHASVLERLFGTTFAASKVDVHDADYSNMQNNLQHSIKKLTKFHPPYWDSNRMTYVTQSVAIDPASGTAADKKLYNFEVIPPGISFNVKLTGQNLHPLEMGLLLFGLKGFNDPVYPVTLGAMSARGFGQFDWELTQIRFLDKNGLSDWIKKAIDDPTAGFNALDALSVDEQQKYIDSFKDALKDALSPTPTEVQND